MSTTQNAAGGECIELFRELIEPTVLQELLEKSDDWDKVTEHETDSAEEAELFHEAYRALRDFSIKLTVPVIKFLQEELLDLEGNDLCQENKSFRKALYQTYVNVGLATPITLAEMENITVSSGKKYWFKLKGAFYC